MTRRPWTTHQLHTDTHGHVTRVTRQHTTAELAALVETAALELREILYHLNGDRYETAARRLTALGVPTTLTTPED